MPARLSIIHSYSYIPSFYYFIVSHPTLVSCLLFFFIFHSVEQREQSNPQINTLSLPIYYPLAYYKVKYFYHIFFYITSHLLSSHHPLLLHFFFIMLTFLIMVVDGDGTCKLLMWFCWIRGLLQCEEIFSFQR